MTDSPSDPYDQLPYERCGIPTTSPERLATLASFSGFAIPDLKRAKVLEIGSGDGGNLIPLAFHHPEWEFVGIDPSVSAIEKAQHGRAELKLDNLQFDQQDVRNYEVSQRYDFVICHGVFSWVDAEVQTAILRVAATALSPNGLFYLSYNTEPGWRIRGLVRDRLRRGSSKASITSQTRAASASLDALKLLMGDAEGPPYLAMLRHEIQFAAERPSFHLAHEYLAEHNQAFWFGDVLDAAKQHALHYVGDAQRYRPEGWIPHEQRALAKEQFATLEEQEECLDLVRYRQMRASVFARSQAVNDAMDHEALLKQSIVVTPLQLAASRVDLHDDSPLLFACPMTKTEVMPETALEKAALLVLGPTYPRGMSFDELLKQATRLLEHEGIARTVAEAEVNDLLQGFAQLQSRALLEARPSQPEWGISMASELPVAHELARYEARERPHLTSAAHDLFPVDDVDRLLIAQLDGTAQLEDLRMSLNEAKIADAEARINRLLALIVQWGFAVGAH